VNDGPSRVLQALRESGDRPCSGEDLSGRLSVSRAQIWKHVGALRKRGYQIEGEPGGGYRLTGIPDCLYPEEILNGLDTRWLARDIRYFAEIDSTNRVAHELGAAGAVHGTTVVAEAQSAGRGRLGRHFFSPPNENLYTSVVLRPTVALAEAPTLILSTAVAVAEAVAETVGDPGAVEIKWPNDVLLGGLKTSGILMELSAEAARVAFVVVGIGVNLNVERSRFPDEFRHLATSLRSHTGHRVDRLQFSRRLYATLERRLDEHAQGGFAALRSRFDAFFRMSGRTVDVHDMTGRDWSGVARGIAESGALEVERADGELVSVIAADVTLARPAT